MKGKTIKKVNKIGSWISFIVAIISVLFLMWFAISFIEVVSKNLSENPTYWNLNLFKVFFSK